MESSGPPTLWKSEDFVHWRFDGTYFPQAETEKYWAPSKAVSHNDKWYIYPTVNGYMYPAIADSPDGPFSLAKGDSFTAENRLWEKDKVHAIDTEIFVDDDGTPYAFWGSRNVARLKDDMMTIDTLFAPIPTRRQEYSEGPIFFKRKGIEQQPYPIWNNAALAFRQFLLVEGEGNVDGVGYRVAYHRVATNAEGAHPLGVCGNAGCSGELSIGVQPLR